jgi:two-component system NtrC family sensor kinase
MANIATLNIGDLTDLAEAIHRAAEQASSLEECARAVVLKLRENLLDQNGQPASALVRCFKTHTLGELPADVRQTIPDADALPSATNCLTLFATAGDHPAWNARQQSASHQAIPLPSPKIVARSPMIAQLIVQLGLELSDVINPKPEVILDLKERAFNVFYVEDALGSSHIPAQQQFVVPYGIKSVIGFGGVLATGDLFAVIMFLKVTVSRQTAELFQALAVSVKTAFLPFVWSDVFALSKPSVLR